MVNYLVKNIFTADFNILLFIPKRKTEFIRSAIVSAGRWLKNSISSSELEVHLTVAYCIYLLSSNKTLIYNFLKALSILNEFKINIKLKQPESKEKHILCTDLLSTHSSTPV